MNAINRTSHYSSIHNIKKLSNSNQLSFKNNDSPKKDSIKNHEHDNYQREFDNCQRKEKKLQQLEHRLRKFSNYLTYKFLKKQIDELYNKAINLDENSSEYNDFIADNAKIIANKKEIEINDEDGRLSDLAKSDEACIFIMNHDSQSLDPALMAAFSSLLHEEYGKENKGSCCPRPKIIVNEDILATQNEKIRAIANKVGVVGINANLFPTKEDKINNMKKMMPLIKNFKKDKNNIFIFPEGRISGFSDLELKKRFQSGVSELIQIETGQKKRVKVVPLGFAYSPIEKNSGIIHIGNPVYFQKEGNYISVNSGNITPEKGSQGYKEFFYKENSTKDKPLSSEINDESTDPRTENKRKVLTANGIPLTEKEQVPYISGVLCENLRICKEEAKKKLPEGDSNIMWIY
ncbi:MAG: hypothetical protein A2287_09315 [Candidatus Melainabacteria bacterium RIFOXYA12_FULL_32_12]|nr:MAG: hypothetical protein A2287_09315 [Candidatus Melainabacteria bacterium RIFOXYA12_FULL_32_12]